MRFEADIAVADMKRAEIMIQHHLRHIHRAQAKEAGQDFVAILSRACDYARKVVRQISFPEKWLLYCSYCEFTGQEMTKMRPQCPLCGEGLKVWDLSLGQKPKRRYRV